MLLRLNRARGVLFISLKMETDELVSTLRQARGLIASPENWVASGFAENAAGTFVPVGSPYAVRFSAIGAIMRACRGSRELFQELRLLLARDPEGRNVHGPLCHADALRLFDWALGNLGETPRWLPKQSGFVSRGVDADPMKRPERQRSGKKLSMRAPKLLSRLDAVATLRF